MRTWFTVSVILILGAILVALSMPAVSVGIVKTDATEALSNCRQLQMSIEIYIKQKNRSPDTLPTLLDEGFIDNELFQKITKGKGVYLFYFRNNMNNSDILIEAFLPKAHVTMTAGGDGMIIPIRNNN